MENASEGNTDDNEIFEDFCPPKYAVIANLSDTFENNQFEAYTSDSKQDSHVIGAYHVFQSGIQPDSENMLSEKRFFELLIYISPTIEIVLSLYRSKCKEIIRFGKNDSIYIGNSGQKLTLYETTQFSTDNKLYQNAGVYCST